MEMHAQLDHQRVVKQPQGLKQRRLLHCLRRRGREKLVESALAGEEADALHGRLSLLVHGLVQVQRGEDLGTLSFGYE